ncbi:MAG: deoxynucleoside kinase [Nitrososphaera sp.]|jgi:deoxyadenosine/deoxycytidine kinase
MMQKFVNITGNIGAGTTTLCQRLCGIFKWIPNYSQAHKSPFLKRYYQEKGNYAFQNQVYILMQSILRHAELDFSTQVVCQDYVINEHNGVYSNVMLSRGYIDINEYALLEQILDSRRGELHQPDLLIFLRADIDTLNRRIKGRNRDAEQTISMDYLNDLQTAFNKFVGEWKSCPIIEINTTDIDITTDTAIKDITSQFQWE